MSITVKYFFSFPQIYAVIFCGLAGASYSLSALLLQGIVLVMYYVDFAIYGLVFICSIIAIVGVSKVGSTSGNNYTYYESGN
jgi:hypothetical protein